MYSSSDCTKYDRINDKSFCACISGTFTSDTVDSHGHIVPKEEQERFVDQMAERPESRIVSIRHDREVQLGEIIWAGVRETEGTSHLIGAIGVYEDSRKYLQEMENGNLGGFSLTVSKFLNTNEARWESDQANIRVESQGSDLQIIQHFVETFEIPARVRVKKAAEGALVLDAIVQNSPVILQLVLAIWQWRQRKNETGSTENPTEKSEQTNTTIEINGDVIVIGEQDISELIDSISNSIDEKITEDTKQQLIAETKSEAQPTESEGSSEKR